ncbi:SDR family oxidoreductase [Acuticoccus kandeliae]|uniref:SDR family oxidoreductase n=1 Tax=Acuticoccus kandeliae TaxID=2073160 RepID=UPI00196BA8AA|nr:SDR family oxidoreductase [Acuticoccus kandeliae]
MTALLPIDATGQRVIVTAGGSGIGRVIAESFLARGAKVHICDVDEAALAETLSANPGLTGIVADVSDPAAIDALFASALEALGGLDVLVNNAGIAGPVARVEDISPEALHATLAVNLEAQFFASARAVPLLKAEGGGTIINLSSVAGRLSFALRTPYSAAKWGVVGFTRSLALEAGQDNIRVNAILPGHVNGPRFGRVVAAKAAAAGISEEEMRADMLGRVALKSTVEMQDIANMALYLASPFGATITGQAISVCGGVEMMG